MLKSTSACLLFTVLSACVPTFFHAQQPKVQIDEAPAALSSTPFILLDAVVAEQWPATLPEVNAPANMLLLNPGQCIRVGVVADGKGHEHYLDGVSIAYRVVTPIKTFTYAAQPAGASKLIKPIGGDFVTAALKAGGISNPLLTTAVMAVSSEKWCVPLDAEGNINIKTSVILRDKTTPLTDQTVQIESINTAAAKSFKNEQELGNWLMTYHTSPEPGRLLAAVQFLTTTSEPNPIVLEFIKAAFRQDALSAANFGPQIAQMQPFPRMLALSLLKLAGVNLTQPPTLDDKDKQFLATAADLPDPYDMKPTPELFQKLDLLWADFSATGRRKPLEAVTTALAWKSDYDSFVELQKSGKKPASLTESLIRGITYSAAGWSLSSFNRKDPLATDYIQTIIVDPKTPEEIKRTLQTLDSNPAFKQR